MRENRKDREMALVIYYDMIRDEQRYKTSLRKGNEYQRKLSGNEINCIWSVGKQIDDD